MTCSFAISLYASATRPGYIEHALIMRQIDAVVIDLEDSVPVASKDEARDVAAELLTSLQEIPDTLIARVNAPSGPYFTADVTELVPRGLRRLRLPAVRSPGEVDEALALIREMRPTGGAVVSIELMVENAAALQNLEALVAGHPEIVALTLGGSDYLADCGTKDIEVLWEAKRELVAKAHRIGLPAYDTVYGNFHDRDAVWDDARRAANLGFDGKSIIHPAQALVTREAVSAA